MRYRKKRFLSSVVGSELFLFILTHFELCEPGTLSIQFLNDKLLLWQGSALLSVSIFSENRRNFLDGCSNSE
jgi:hypothetical protein